MEKDRVNKNELISEINRLIDKALNRKFLDTDKIRSYSEYKAVQNYYTVTLEVLRMCKSMEKKLYRDYLKNILKSQDTLQEVLLCKKMLICIDFYMTEAKNIKEVLDEFVGYTINGHIISVLSGKQREILE